MLLSFIKKNEEYYMKSKERLDQLESKEKELRNELFKILSNAGIITRADYVRLVFYLKHVFDNVIATSNRLSFIKEFPSSIEDDIVDFINKLDDVSLRLRDAIVAMKLNESKKCLSLVQHIEKLEEEIDGIRLKLTERVYDMRLLTAVKFRLIDLIEHLENVADSIEDAANNILLLVVR